ncbi:GNAT family N-acetyltransferase [Dyella sp. KRB-257]|uniref:GNAT family N-acetyltransferase n=1 Tax=Dyella sp. KRB-257 TaxID=3400915 RepID=UPI003C0989E9
MVKLIEVSDAHRAAIASGIDALSRLLGLMVPTGWPVYPDIFERPTNPAWPFFLFANPDQSTIVGSGGFLTGPDNNGFVQIGYEVAPEHRGHGIATQAMLEIISLKPDAHLVAVVAPTNCPSIAVLRKLGLKETGQVIQHANEPLSLWASTRAAA